MSDSQPNLRSVVRALSFLGDLSMGQAVEHSPRVAWLARRLGAAVGLEPALAADLGYIALLRWSGCTANAGVAASAVEDDVEDRAAMLSLQPGRVRARVGMRTLASRLVEMADINCEVCVAIARCLGLNEAIAESLQCVFEQWDGGGPRRLAGPAIPLPAQLVRLASELETLARVGGVQHALDGLASQAGVAHAPALVALAAAHARDWLGTLDREGCSADTGIDERGDAACHLGIVADVADLKLPWLLGHSRAVAAMAGQLSPAIGLSQAQARSTQAAALLVGLGRVATPNAVWNRPHALSADDWERVRLAPYWLTRASALVPGLAQEADIASRCYERLDGSGYFRGTRQADTPTHHRLLPVAAAWVALRSGRPWRPALPPQEALALLQREAGLGRLDRRTVEAVADIAASRTKPAARPPDTAQPLSDREVDVLRCVSLGNSNKAAAQLLGISPSTVRTHLESVFRKLDCRSRAAATLKATQLGLF